MLFKEMTSEEMAEIRFEDGKREGKEKGIKQGLETKALEIAQNMKVKNMPLETIVEITGLKKEQVEKL